MSPPAPAVLLLIIVQIFKLMVIVHAVAVSIIIVVSGVLQITMAMVALIAHQFYYVKDALIALKFCLALICFCICSF